jgi:hypothetical protein
MREEELCGGMRVGVYIPYIFEQKKRIRLIRNPDEAVHWQPENIRGNENGNGCRATMSREEEG